MPAVSDDYSIDLTKRVIFQLLLTLFELLETWRRIVSKREKWLQRLDESKAREETDSSKTEGRENKKAR